MAARNVLVGIIPARAHRQWYRKGRPDQTGDFALCLQEHINNAPFGWSRLTVPSWESTVPSWESTAPRFGFIFLKVDACDNGRAVGASVQRVACV